MRPGRGSGGLRELARRAARPLLLLGCAALCLLLFLPPGTGRAASADESWVAFRVPEGWRTRRSDDKAYPLLWVEIDNRAAASGAGIFVRAACHVSQGVYSGNVESFIKAVGFELEAAGRRAGMAGVAGKPENVSIVERPWQGYPGAVASYRSSGGLYAAGVGYTRTIIYACRPDAQKRRDYARDIWVTISVGESASEADKALVRDVILPSFRLKRLEQSGK